MATVPQHLVHPFGIRRSPQRVRGRILSVQFSPRRPARRSPRLAAAHERILPDPEHPRRAPDRQFGRGTGPMPAEGAIVKNMSGSGASTGERGLLLLADI